MDGASLSRLIMKLFAPLCLRALVTASLTHRGAGIGLALALILDLDAVEQAVPKGAPGRARLREVRATGDRIGREAHDLALELRPTALGDLGVSAALSAYVAGWSRRTRIAATFEPVGLDGGRLPSNPAHPTPGEHPVTSSLPGGVPSRQNAPVSPRHLRESPVDRLTQAGTRAPNGTGPGVSEQRPTPWDSIAECRSTRGFRKRDARRAPIAR
jgi:hypothetical protein